MMLFKLQLADKKFTSVALKQMSLHKNTVRGESDTDLAKYC